MQKKIGGLGYWDDLAITLQYKQIRLLVARLHNNGCISSRHEPMRAWVVGFCMYKCIPCKAYTRARIVAMAKVIA